MLTLGMKQRRNTNLQILTVVYLTTHSLVYFDSSCEFLRRGIGITNEVVRSVHR